MYETYNAEWLWQKSYERTRENKKHNEKRRRYKWICCYFTKSKLDNISIDCTFDIIFRKNLLKCEHETNISDKAIANADRINMYKKIEEEQKNWEEFELCTEPKIQNRIQRRKEKESEREQKATTLNQSTQE